MNTMFYYNTALMRPSQESERYPLVDTFIERGKDPTFRDAVNKGVPVPILLGQPVLRELPVLPPQRRSMDGILEDIAFADLDPTESFFECQINGRVEQKHIEKLLQLPYEVSIVEVNGELVFRTEEPRTVGTDEEMRRRLIHTKLFFHSHPIVAGRHIQSNTPSFPDLKAAARLAGTNVIASEEGILIYGRPDKDPLTGGIYSGETDDLIKRYCRGIGINYEDDIPDESLKFAHDLSEEDRILLQQQFAARAGVIKSQASWDDGGVAAIVEVINKRGQEEPANLERAEKARKWLANPYHLPTIDEVYDAFGGLGLYGMFRLSPDWYRYIFNSPPRYEVLTQEYVSALGKYLADRIRAYIGKTDRPIRILEIGAGNGQLSYFLDFYLQAIVPDQASIIATDKNEPIQNNFPVEVIDYMDAIRKYKPAIVINSWMPLGQDWTEECRKIPEIQEIILIGYEDFCGTPESWEEDASFTRFDLQALEAVQISRTENPSTVSLRR